MKSHELEALGEADLEIAGLRLWVHGRQFPNATDYWDGNWLRVTAYCVYPDAMIRTHGAIVHLGEVARLLQECEQAYESVAGEAALRCIEPNLQVVLSVQWNGCVKVHIEITPDHMRETHSFEDAIDQTYLPAIIAQCQAILVSLPVQGPAGGA